MEIHNTVDSLAANDTDVNTILQIEKAGIFLSHIINDQNIESLIRENVYPGLKQKSTIYT